MLTAEHRLLKNPPYDAVPAPPRTPSGCPARTASSPIPAEPALPLVARNVTATDDDLVLRGVGFRGGTYVDTANIVPLTGAPTTELRGVHAPFVSPVFYPMRLWSPNYFGALGEHGGTNLLITPAQHKSDPANAGKSIQRKYTGLDLKLFYSGNLTTAALSDAPTIVDVQTEPSRRQRQLHGPGRRRSQGCRPRRLDHLHRWHRHLGAARPHPGRDRFPSLDGHAAVGVGAGEPQVRRPGRQRLRPRLVRRQPWCLLQRCRQRRWCRRDIPRADLPAGKWHIRPEPGHHRRAQGWLYAPRQQACRGRHRRFWGASA